jgi:hypothetical protein
MDSRRASIDVACEPTPEGVFAACERFDRENDLTERALAELFGQYPGNENDAHILLKVVALNGLYHTQILALHDVANHIYERGKDIDSALRVGSPEIVDTIAEVVIPATERTRHNWSFATKYCSWHRPDSYPIWDSRVSAYLRWLTQKPSGSFLLKNPDNWKRYGEFVEMVHNLRRVCGLGEFSFKQIDKFLYTEGEKLIAEKERRRAAKMDAADTSASTQL